MAPAEVPNTTSLHRCLEVEAGKRWTCKEKKGNYFRGPKKVLLSFLIFFSRTWLFGPKMNFLRFIGPSVSLMG